jgi:hypothetical protein
MQKPRTVTKMEMIEKSVPVEREVMVEKPYTEHVQVCNRPPAPAYLAACVAMAAR